MVVPALEARRRPTSFRSAVTVDEGRRSRSETIIQLRKSKKDDILKKRRGMVQGGAGVTTTTTTTMMTTTTTTMAMMMANPNPMAAAADKSSTTTTTNIPELERLVDSSSSSSSSMSSEAGSQTNSNNVLSTSSSDIQKLVGTYHSWIKDPASVSAEELHATTKAFRRILAREQDLPVKQVVDAGVIPFFVMMLRLIDHPDLVFEAAWALTNVASTSFSPVVANQPEAVQQLANLLLYHTPNVREQVGWCLGNIAGDSIAFRDGVLATPGVIEGMVKNLENIANESMLQNITWASSNMLRGKPVVPLHQVRPFLPPMINILNVCQAKEIPPALQVDTVWALSYITEGGDDYVQAALDCGMLSPLMTIIRHHSHERNLLIPAARTIGNVVAGTDDMTDAVLREGLLDHAVDLMGHASKSVRKDMCWMISNVAAGTAQQCQQIMATGSNYKLVKLLVKYGCDACWDVRKEAVWAICNLVTNLPLTDLQTLVKKSGALRVLEQALCMEGETKLVLVVLDALERVFQECGESATLRFDELGGLEQLEELQNHQNNDVYEKAVHIIVQYFGGEDDQDLDQNIAPALHDDSFSFGLPSKQLFPDGGHGSPMSPPPTFEFSGCQSPSTFSSFGEIAQI